MEHHLRSRFPELQGGAQVRAPAEGGHAEPGSVHLGHRVVQTIHHGQIVLVGEAPEAADVVGMEELAVAPEGVGVVVQEDRAHLLRASRGPGPDLPRQHVIDVVSGDGGGATEGIGCVGGDFLAAPAAENPRSGSDGVLLLFLHVFSV